MRWVIINDDKDKEKRCIIIIIVLALVRLALYLANGTVCGITFYQPEEPELNDFFERRDFE